jgi:hypothetical protein
MRMLQVFFMIFVQLSLSDPDLANLLCILLFTIVRARGERAADAAGNRASTAKSANITGMP